MRGEKFFRIEVGYEQDRKRINALNYVIKCNKKVQAVKFGKSVLRENFKQVDKSEFEDVSRKIYPYLKGISDGEGKVIGDYFAIHGHKFGNGECVDVMFFDLHKATQEEFNRPYWNEDVIDLT